MEGMVRCSANYVPLSPISFLQRSALVYRDRTSVVHGSVRFTWSQTFRRCKSLASSLSQLGVSYGDVVAALLPNVPAMYELHFGVPMAGAILCALNTHHDSKMLAVLLRHSNAKLIFVDPDLFDAALGAINILSNTNTNLPTIVLVADEQHSETKLASQYLEYEGLLARGEPEFDIKWPKDESDPISLNYTSGTTSNPKGVIFSHRGAYLNSLSAILANDLASMPVYLWTLPMFHCNGWCFTWAIAAQGGSNICLRAVSSKAVFDNISNHKVSVFCGAPTMLNMIINTPKRDLKPLIGKVTAITGGAAPPPHVIFKMEELGFSVSHEYGLTETYGPATLCTWMPEWDDLPAEERARIRARQGVSHIGLQDVDVKDPYTMESVPHDGKTMGEVMIRGNTVMSGYLKDVEATGEAFRGGWFRSGDLGVRHPGGYIELKDRSKDIVISGGENVSTIEVEATLFKHPGVLEAAVVGRPDDHWGESVCAFVRVKDGERVSGGEIMEFCRENLPHYMAPRSVVFSELPKTSTGKTQKFVLRERAKAMGSLSSKL